MKNMVRNVAAGIGVALALAGALLLSPPDGWSASSGGNGGPREWRPLAVVAYAGGTAFASDIMAGGGPTYGGGVRWRISKNFGLGVMLEKCSGSEVGTTNLMFNGQLFFPGRGRLLPYAIAGVGFNSIEFTSDDPTYMDLGVIVDRMALQLGGGLDWRFSSRLSIMAEGRGNLVKTWIRYGPASGPIRDTDPATQDIIHLYGLTFSAGLKLSF